jgi:hypothetical protein
MLSRGVGWPPRCSVGRWGSPGSVFRFPDRGRAAAMGEALVPELRHIVWRVRGQPWPSDDHPARERDDLRRGFTGGSLIFCFFATAMAAGIPPCSCLFLLDRPAILRSRGSFAAIVFSALAFATAGSRWAARIAPPRCWSFITRDRAAAARRDRSAAARVLRAEGRRSRLATGCWSSRPAARLGALPWWFHFPVDLKFSGRARRWPRPVHQPALVPAAPPAPLPGHWYSSSASSRSSCPSGRR